MELLNPAYEKKERQLWRAQGVILLLAIFYCLYALITLCLSPHAVFSARDLPMPILDYAKIGKGPLAISSKVVSPEFEPLVQELILIGKNSRPDAGSLPRISLGLKSSGSHQEVVSGQKLFLDPSYRFSQEKTDLSLVPLAVSGSSVLVQLEGFGKLEEIVLTPSSLFQRPMEESYVESMKKSKMWAPDIFLTEWGGDEYRNLSDKQKVEIDNKVYFLSQGDTLWWDEGEWKKGSSPLADAPAAQVVAASQQKMTMQIWDPSGYLSSFIEIPLQHGERAPVKAEEVITSVKFRSPTEITCHLGKRRVVVREGDWWIKTDRRWRSLRTADDLEAFLRHELQGELFIFEKIESAKGKITLKARCFDKMRTESQPLSLVVNTEKKPSTLARKHHSSSSLLAKHKMTVPPLQHQNSDGEEKE